jgi:hypothetical protein
MVFTWWDDTAVTMMKAMNKVFVQLRSCTRADVAVDDAPS